MTQTDLLQDDILSTSPQEDPPPVEKAEKTANPESNTNIAEEEKSANAFKTISEVARFLSVPQHVLRFWESKFSQIKPLKMRGGRRYYRPEDIETLSTIKTLLYKQGYTIKGAKKAFAKDKDTRAAKAEKQAEKKAAPAAITDKQKSQLTVIRQELSTLQNVLKPYIY